MTTTTIQTLAIEARSFFTTGTRTATGDTFHKTTDDAPEWVKQLCMDAHRDMGPDDHRYAFIVEALDALAESEDSDDANLEADIYTHELLRWLSSRADRPSYCDEAMEEFGGEFTDTVALISQGQYYEKSEVLNLVKSSLEARAEETPDTCDDCGEEMESCCDGIVRCLNCSPCPACSDGPGPDDEDSDNGPDEDDITTTDHRKFYQSGKLWLSVDEDDDYRSEVKAQMERDGFYPNVWFISDHGNVHTIDLDSAE